MARKVFLSVLGTGFYNRCVYKKDGFKSKETRFIQQATLENLNAKDWGEDDVVYVFLTESAKVNNWNIEGNKRAKFDGTEEEYAGLEKELSRMGIKAKIEGVDIKDGNTEAELWENFSIIYDKLNKEDELYFDITHAFRYLPMFLLVLVDYAKFLKSVKVELVSYGNFEARDKDKNEAPLMDITSLVKLQEWTKAAADFVESGRVDSLNEVGKKKTIQLILKETKGKDEKAKNLQDLFNSLSSFSNQILFCRGGKIVNGISANLIKKNIVNSNREYIKPLSPLFDEFWGIIRNFKENNIDNMYYAAKLCASYGNYQSAVTLLREWVVSVFCNRHGRDIFNEAERNEVTNAIKNKNRKEEDKTDVSKNYATLFNAVNNDALLQDGRISREFSIIVDARNDFNHAGIRANPDKYKTIQSKIESAIEAFSVLLEKCSSKQQFPAIFINFSNHPYAQWSEEQKKASEEFGKCVDLQFPQIEPMATSGEISKLADEYEDKIKEIADGKKATVHIMGEMSFTYSMIERLKALGICCVCSTTYRLVKDEGNGKRYVEFQFRQFRNYV